MPSTVTLTCHVTAAPPLFVTINVAQYPPSQSLLIWILPSTLPVVEPELPELDELDDELLVLPLEVEMVPVDAVNVT